MYFHEKIHNSLPGLCFAMGLIFILGAAYIGVGHPFTVGYAVLGVTCVIAGTFMGIIRRRLRAVEVRSKR